MFQSYKITDYIAKNNQYRFEYKIVDSDFEELGFGVAFTAVWFEIGLAVAVIDTYEKKGLPVPINLALAFEKSMRDFPQYDENITNAIFYNRTYNPKYLPYAEETEQQLQRIMNIKTFW